MPRFTSPPDPEAFAAAVWDLVRRIPVGMVCTYGRLAELVGPPPGMDPVSYRAFGPRWVGGAMARCPDDVPWWRVINAQGRISPRPGAQRQRELLEGEGVAFGDRGRVDLQAAGWEPTADRSG